MKECLIDTDIISFYMRGDEVVKSHVERYLFVGNFDKLTISEVSYYEIRAGLELKKAKRQIHLFEDFAQHCKMVKLTKRSLDISAIRYRKLRKKDIEIGTPDLLIAGVAIDNDLTLVTNNPEHYLAIEGLTLANWRKKLKPPPKKEVSNP
ncbi:MAG: type II toxin-antitoxin system VapC family toxin [Cyclobacteriaceae bacterium]